MALIVYPAWAGNPANDGGLVALPDTHEEMHTLEHSRGGNLLTIWKQNYVDQLKI